MERGNKAYKQRKKVFADNMIKNGFNGRKSVENITQSTSENYKRVMASRYMNDDEVIELIRQKIEKFDKTLISKELVLMNLFEITKDNKIKPDSKIRANELLGKYLSMFKDDKIQVNTNFIADSTLESIRNRRITPNIDSLTNKKTDSHNPNDTNGIQEA